MDTIYLFIIFAIGLIIAIGIGMEISKGIEDTIITLLFWFLYIITIITFINIIMVGNYYLTMRNKTGPPGRQGVHGEQGDKGDAGKCDADCRDQYCINYLIGKDGVINNKLKNLNQGVNVDLNNIYIKSKAAQMCSSDEFKQLSPYNGPNNLVRYIGSIWEIWIELIYNSGGKLYFETIGAEDQFDWIKSTITGTNDTYVNPFDELRKYDVFYWGMGMQYRPKLVERCYGSNDGNTPIPGGGGYILQIAKTDLYDKITDDAGSRAVNDVSIWRAKQFTYQGAVFYPLGDLLMGPSRNGESSYSNKHIGAITYPHPQNGPSRETIIASGDLKGPVNYELLWSNKASSNKFWVWRPIAPAGYIALGDVITTSADPPLTGNQAPIRCIPAPLAIKLPSNGNVLWSSLGSREPINFNMLGFIPNTSSSGYTGANDSNAYNLFRGVVGTGTSIPDSDVNGSFYYIDPNQYDTTYQLGRQNGMPNINRDSNKVGKGYIPTTQKDSKYSVLAYLQLKNQPLLTHKKTTTQLHGKIIDNAIGNTFALSSIATPTSGVNCLTINNGAIKQMNYDPDNENQYFSIIMTGNIKNECRVIHKNTGKYLKYNSGLFSLQDTSDKTEQEYLIYNMS
jgi:hypothetical protein